jgi:hypothetical protein
MREMKKEPRIKVVIVEPRKMPRIETIDNNLETFQKLVGGYIEVVQSNEFIDIIINEEGKLIGLEPNFRLSNGDVIVGTAIFCSHAGAEFVSLPHDWDEFIHHIFTEKRLRENGTTD